jgi:hypothetical protein
MGFTMPHLSPNVRCALTAPSHPYLSPGGLNFFSTVRYVTIPRRYLASRSMEPGLSSRYKIPSDCNVVVCFLAINSRIIDKVFCIPCFLNQYVKNLFLISLSLDWGGKCKKVFSNTATLICFFSKKFSLWKTV